jgi:hypothetical protein
MTTPLEALISLSRRDPTPEHFSAFSAEVKDEKNNRGVAILLAANAEIALRTAIHRNLLVKEDSYSELFHAQRGILSSFEAKIRIGYSMGIYGDVHKINLDCIKAIRNAYAHSAQPISFDTPEVKAVCDLMQQVDAVAPRAVNAKTGKVEHDLLGNETPRERYIKICGRVAHNLFWIGTTISPGIQCDPTNAYVPMTARHVPLP